MSLLTKFKRVKRIRTYHIFLFVIVSVGGFFRFYNTPLRYTIGDDSSRDALVVLEAVKNMQVPLIGPFSSLGPFTFGPWYYYQLMLFTFVAPFTYAPWIFMGVCSVLFIFVMYKIGEILENKTFGLILAFLAAMSPVQILTGVALSNPWIVSLYSALSIWMFLKLLQKDVSKWIGLFLGISLGIGINSHYSMLALLVLPIIYVLYKPKQYIISSFIALGIILTFIPLLLFDLQNNWYNMKNITYTYIHMKERIYVANSWTIYLRDFWPRYWSETIGIPYMLGVGIMLAAAVSIVVAFIRKKLSIRMILLLIAFFVEIVQLRYYGGERFISYLQYLQPFVFIFTGYLFFQIYKLRYGKFLLLVVLVGLSSFIFPKSIFLLTEGSFERQTHRDVEYLLNTYPDKKFALYNCGEYNYARMQAIMYILYKNNKVDKSGKKIAFIDERCTIPLTKKNIISVNSLVVLQADMIDLSKFNDKQLSENGWKYQSSKQVYDKTVNWWKEKKI